MFENIIGQDNIVGRLKREIEEGNFPHAALFHGAPYTGKLSTALEAARALTCEKGKGEWSCTCKTCGSQRLLTHPYTILLGSHAFDLEIQASADVLKRTRKSSAQFLFIRAVHKLTRRFDAFLWEGEESKIRTVIPIVTEIEELLGGMEPGHELPPEKELEKLIDGITALCQKAAQALSDDNIPINQIRRAVYWMHLSSTSKRKVVILENADRMHDASRNSLLKILEEPPESAHLVLLTANKGGIIPTIRSRLRNYDFAERTAEDVAAVLKRIFQEDTSEYSSLSDYFLYWREMTPDILRQLAERFFQLIWSNEGESEDILQEMAPLFSTRSDRNSVSYFLEELIRVLRALLHDQKIPLYLLKTWSEIIQAKYGELNRYNLNAKLVLESLFYSLREVGIEEVHPKGVR